jgi:hypothetical protein
VSTEGDPGSTASIRRLIGVYNADGTLRGELTYWVGARLGRAHCALCDITHGSVRERPDWIACRAGLPVPFETYHRNDQPPDVRELLGHRTPAVVADTDHGLMLLLGPDELAACVASPDRLAEALTLAAKDQQLTWSGSG